MAFHKIKLAATRTEWLKQRQNGIGGSDASVVCGLNPYKSPYSLWAEKTGQVKDDFQGNEKTRLGTDLEEYVARRFCEATGKKVRKSGFMFQSADYPFMLANVDRLIVGENAGLECKTAGQNSDYDFKNGEIPPAYYVQCQHYMQVLGFDKWYIAILQFQEGLFWFEIERDEEEAQRLIEYEAEFWAMVESQTPPELDGMRSTGETLNWINPADNDKKADSVLIDVHLNLLERHEQIKNEIEALENEKELIRNKIKSFMGDCGTCKNDRFSIRYKEQTRKDLDRKTFREEEPEIYLQYLKETKTRPLVVTKLKKKK